MFNFKYFTVVMLPFLVTSTGRHRTTYNCFGLHIQNLQILSVSNFFFFAMNSSRNMMDVTLQWSSVMPTLLTCLCWYGVTHIKNTLARISLSPSYKYWLLWSTFITNFAVRCFLKPHNPPVPVFTNHRTNAKIRYTPPILLP